MKILYINNFFSQYGGAEHVMMIIGELMKQKGHDVYYYATDKQPYFYENYEYASFFPEFSDKRAKSFKNFTQIFNIFYNNSAKKNLIKYLKKINPDVVNIHNVQFHLTFSVLDACRELNIPVAMYLHDPRIFCPGGTLSYGETYCHKEPCIKGNPIPCIQKKCKSSSVIASVLASLNYLFIKHLKINEKVNSFVCPSSAIAELAIRAGIPESKINVIPHFISQEEFNITPNYENKGYFLYVGRLDKEKGVHTLIKAMENVPSDIGLHIVGKGYEMQNLQKQVQDLNLANVIFKGYLNGKELYDEYQNCIATILPCNWFEVFGRTNLESFLHGKPVIASRIAAIPEIVENNINGILIEPKNIKQLSLAMITLTNDWKKAQELGENGRIKTEKLYNAEIYYQKYYALLESLV